MNKCARTKACFGVGENHILPELRRGLLAYPKRRPSATFMADGKGSDAAAME